ncbi:MAG: ABC-F family ATP-binding cassette domain-containing protein [Bacilli bacterium]|nr:ABC-F family ATP-binding cassette domain-containing protein [Bacilli bacterium]
MLLTVENLNLTFDKKRLFKDASFRILNGEKIGVVGSNGVGKTTLINILCGKIIPDSGKIEFDKKIKVGYLDQYMNIDKHLTIDEYLKLAFKDLYKKEQEMNQLLDEIKNSTNQVVIDRNVRLTTMIREELETNDFYALNSKVARIASGLGITNYGMNTVMKNLSGGQKVKVILAKLLLEKPDLLILDEPTNFLDTVHVDWLVKYLKEYKGNFLIVSHNQEFLDDVVNVILEIEFGKITKFKGNYQTYLVKKAQMMENYEKQFKAQQREIKTLETYIQKNKVKTSTARQAKSREKMLERIEVMDAPQSADIKLNLYFEYSPIASHKFLEVKDLEIGYTSSLLPPISFTIKSGTRLAVTGFNGIGKSTLLKTLIGQLKPICGSYKFVDNVKIAYFEQEHNFDNMNISAMDEIHNLYPALDHKTIRGLLARCGLRGDMVLQPIKTLSGGELSKLKLCKIMMIKSNVLILDEPTNHLDVNAKEGLLEALKKYQGTIIFVSHERDFIDKLATEIYSFEDLLLS